MQSTGWDFVDDISIHLVGAVLEKDKRVYGYLKKWSASDNFWMRRASMISQVLLFRHNKGDKKLFFGFAGKMLHEKEFFIRKAIGWCVREISKASPDEAFDFLMKIKDRASGLTLREGAKRLPPQQREMILDIR
jgi:3-methyladenine DNA glycosylase AlkD